MARDHILFVLDLRSKTHYQLLGHSLWTRLVGSFDFSAQFLLDLTIFLFHVLKFFLIFEQWPSQTEHNKAAKLLSYRTSEFAIRTNESLLSQSYAITVIMAPQVYDRTWYKRRIRPSEHLVWPQVPRLRITYSLLLQKGEPTVQGSSSESKDTQRYATVHPEDCTDWKRLPGLTRKRRLYDTKSVNGTLQGHTHQLQKEISTTLVLWRTWCPHGRHNVIRSPRFKRLLLLLQPYSFDPEVSVVQIAITNRITKDVFFFC